MTFHVKTVCVLLLTVLLLNSSLSDDSIGCDSSADLQEEAKNEPLDIYFQGDIKTFFDVKIASIVTKRNNEFDKLYIDARLENVDDRVDLIIFTTENFEKYVEEQTSPEICLNMKFECSGGTTRTLLFFQKFKRDNYFAPEFSQDQYTLVIPTPLYKGFQLTTFGEIYATDNDLWDNEVKFSSTDSESFKISVGTLQKRDNKKFYASIELMSIILSLNEQIEFSIIATDAGNPPKTSLPAKVVIKADSSNSLPPIPKFAKTIVYGSLTEDLKLTDLEVILDPTTYTTDVIFKKLLDDEDIFEIQNIDNIVYVTLSKQLDVEFLKGRERLTFDVEASNSRLTEVGRTAVSISLPNQKELRFTNGLYKGTLSVKLNALDIEDFKVVADENELEQFDFVLQGQHVDLFDIERSQNTIKLNLKSSLSANVWTNVNYILFKLLARTGLEEIASTNIIIDVTHTTLAFQKPAYTGLINSEEDLVLEPIVLLPEPNESDDDIEIQLLQTDAQFFSFIKEGNHIELKLNENTSPGGLQNKAYFRLEVEARETTTGVRTSCLVIIEKTLSKSAMKFEKNIFEAHISPEAELVAENVVLDKDSYSDKIEFSLLGRDAEYFSFKQDENIVTLSLTDTFNPSEHDDYSALWLEIRAVNAEEKFEASAVIIVNIVRDAVPEFDRPNYIGELTQENVLNLSKISLKMSTWRAYTSVELIGQYSELFTHTTVENELEISLKTELPEEVRERSSIVLIAVASNNNLKGYSTVVINLTQSRKLSNVFKKTIQKGQILQDGNIQVLKIDDIELVKEYNVGDFTCNLSGDESSFLDYTPIAPKNVIKLILAAEFPHDIVKSKFYITFLLECLQKDDHSIAGSTIIFLDLPVTDGQQLCPTPEPPTFIPEFENSFYTFYSKPNYVGSLQKVQAVIRGSDADVRYSLRVANEHLRSRINIDNISGEISLSGITSPGRYYFDIVAENVVTHGQSQATGRLDIEALIQCEDHVSVSNSLLIKYLEEEIEHDAILNAKLENCEFKVFSIEPHDQEYVSIDPTTKMLKMIPTDREAAIFTGALLPQIEVKLKLDCTNETMGDFNALRRVERDLNRARVAVENRSLVLTNDIGFSKDTTVLSIILVDINDNRPEFVYPDQERLVVGFPEQKISKQIFSESIARVVARDKDEGLNAKIRYSIQPNEHFQIDPESGQVYPNAHTMQGLNEIDLLVYATDRDGARNGLSSSFTMTIKVLGAEHFILFTFVNENVNSIEALMEDTKRRTGINFIALSHAIVSSTEDVPLFRAGSVQFVQQVWAYAFEGDVPIPSQAIKRKLSESGSTMNISAQTFEEVVAATEESKQSGVPNVTGYIVGLCVFAVITVACIGFIFWRFVYRDRGHIHDEPVNNLSSRGPMNQNFNLKQSAEVDIQKHAEILSDALYEPSFYSKRESVKILGTTTQESTDDGRRRQIEKLNSTLNGSLQENNDGGESDTSNESSKPRATVKFNELVERIHIESDDEEKNKS